MFDRIKTTLLFPAARTIIQLKSEQARLRAWGKKPVVHFEAPFAGQKIMLLAMYEKGVARPDVLRLLRCAKEAGLYVLAVNTLRLSDPASLKGLADCYIERPNFGRDFGSYKTGFLHVYARGWDRTCPRLLMINDSVYFNSCRMPRFLDDMMSSEIEVLGSTENYDEEYHLGSFCIAMSRRILGQTGFKKFWENYRLSDLRPTVIRRGEMGLSKVLRRCASSPQQFSALYSATRFSEQIDKDDELLDFAIRNGRTSPLIRWKRITALGLLDYMRASYLIPVYQAAETGNGRNIGGGGIIVEASVKELDESAFVAGYRDLVDYLRGKLKNPQQFDECRARALTAAWVGEVYMEGSHIHQNATILLYQGLPIVKLDGLYRGVFNLADVGNLAAQLPAQEGSELRRLLMDRPFGGDTLVGWKKAAFFMGYL